MPGTNWTKLWLVLVCITAIIRPGSAVTIAPVGEQHGVVFTYTRDDLMSLRNACAVQVSPDFVIPSECKPYRRRRGKRAGVRVHARKRKYRPFVPSITFGNVRSLSNKMDELHLSCRYLHEFREACVLGFVETWLDDTIPDSHIDIQGFNNIRSDRTELSGKSKGGGCLLYINERWCSNVRIEKKMCTPDIEMLSISARPFYLPREFTNIFITLVYIPPSAVKENAQNLVYDHVNNLADDKPDALHVLMGDMNQCDLKPVLRGYQQNVDCKTRYAAVLDLFYCNVRNAYKCHQLPPCGNSDHNMIHMRPYYRPKLKQSKPQVIRKTVMDNNSTEALRACYDCTDWDLFIADADGNVNTLTDVTSSYITFCSEMLLKQKELKIFPNNKPWMSADLRKKIIEKHRASESYHDLVQILDCNIREAKLAYKSRVEEMFTSNNTKQAWRGLKQLTGIAKRKREPAIMCEPGSAQRLNQFYARFDDTDFSAEQSALRTELQNSVDTTEFTLPEDLVRKAIKRINPKKASGPDGLSAKLLITCGTSLEYIIHKIFELSFSTCTFPTLWKTGEIVPVAKKDLPQVDNDLRPITLTAVLAKCLERVGLWLLMPHMGDQLDTLQFAYINGRSTDDALCHLVHRITEHLDRKSSNTARALYLDYSSAFNTIQPHIMMSKLNALGIPDFLRLWILDFLTERPQYVRTSQEKSDTIALNTGAPQGCVLSPVLFVCYTNDMQWDHDNIFIQKYADDTVIVGLICNDNDAEYLQCTDFVSLWCGNNHLKLNVQKTKEMIWDFRKMICPRQSVKINDTCTDVVSVYKYLGVQVDDTLSFLSHVDCQLGKAQKRLYCVRSMLKLRIDGSLIAMFYRATVPTLLLYAGVVFYTLLTARAKYNLNRPRRTVSRLLRHLNITLESFEDIVVDRTRILAKKIQGDPTHPLSVNFNPLPSGRRLRMPFIRTNRFKKSFVVNAISC